MRKFLAALLLVLFSFSVFADSIVLGAKDGNTKNTVEIHYMSTLVEPLPPNTPTVVILIVNNLPQMAFFNRLDGMFLITVYNVDRFKVSTVLMVHGRPPVHSRELVFNRESELKLPPLEVLRQDNRGPI